MFLITLLETIELHLAAILREFDTADKSTLINCLLHLKNAPEDTDMASISGTLYQLCMRYSFLEDVIFDTPEVNPHVFRGKPVAKSLSAEASKIRLLSNHLIDAIDKQDSLQLPQKNEKKR